MITTTTQLPTVSVVICAFTAERWDQTITAIRSTLDQTAPVLETILVVDYNPELLERARTTQPIRSIPNAEQQGLAGARNTGVAAARGDIVAFLDDDAVAAPDWCARLLAAYQDQDVLGVGGRIEPIWLAKRPGWFPDEFLWVIGCTFRGMPETPSQVSRIIGANMSFRRHVFHQIGGFLHGLGRVGSRPLAGEETEFCLRLARTWPTATLRYDPRARVGHHVPAGRTTWGYFVARCYGEGVSKAEVARRTGGGTALSNERAYTVRTLPAGVARGLRDAIRGDVYGLARAGAIIAGLAITTTGYLLRTVAARTGSTSGQESGTNAPPVIPRDRAGLEEALSRK